MRIREFFTLRIFAETLCLSLLVGCGIGGPLREDKSAVGYQLGSLAAERWTRQAKSESGADTVFDSQKNGSIIALQSVCDRYPNASLESLMKQMLSPLSDREVISESKRSLDGRDSLWTRVRGSLDGVPVESQLVVYRKNNCIFE